MWFVNVRNKNAPGYGKWHFIVEPDAPYLGCGLNSPPWYFRWDDEEWKQAAKSAGIPIRKWFGEEELPELARLPAATKCSKCWKVMQLDRSRTQRARLLAAMLADGKPEVTTGSLVTLRQSSTGEEFTCCFGAVAGMDGEIEVCTLESPIGKAVLGRFVADEVTVETPVGHIVYAIVQAASSCGAIEA